MFSFRPSASDPTAAWRYGIFIGNFAWSRSRKRHFGWNPYGSSPILYGVFILWHRRPSRFFTACGPIFRVRPPMAAVP
jgi:hypothetical protein